MGYFDQFGKYTSDDTTAAESTPGNSYETQTGDTTLHFVGDLNAYRNGYSNTLVDGFNYSTTLGPSFSTTVGSCNQTTVGVNIQTTVGVNIQVTLGLWEAEIKAVAIQNAVNRGKVFEWNAVETYESKTGMHYSLKPSGETEFAQQYETYAKTNSLVANDDVRNIVNGKHEYTAFYSFVATDSYEAAGACMIKRAREVTIEASTVASMTVASQSIRVTPTNTTIIGAIVNIG